MDDPENENILNELNLFLSNLCLKGSIIVNLYFLFLIQKFKSADPICPHPTIKILFI